MTTAFLHAQDTVFVRSLPIKVMVKNIDTDGKELLIRSDSLLYYWRDEKLEFIDKAQLKFSVLEFDQESKNHVINEFTYLPREIRNKNRGLSNILPGSSNPNITSARIGDYLYVCYNRKVLQYKVHPHFQRKHSGKSIRHIYTSSDFRVISTYSGIYVDTIWNVFSDFTAHLNSVDKFSNGAFVKIDSNFFLCQSNLLIYNQDIFSFETFIATERDLEFRNLIKFNNKTYALYNKAFGPVDLIKKQILPFTINAIVSDCIVFKDKVYIGSGNSILYELDTDNVIREYQAQYPINALEIINGVLHVGTSKGLFVFEDSTFKEIIPGLEVVNMLYFHSKLIVNNNYGLYCINDKNLVELIKGVEFNKMALGADDHYLYAGSVEGLFIFNNSELNNLINSNKRIADKLTAEKIDTNNLTLIFYVLVGFSFLVIITIIIYYYRFKSVKRELLHTINRKSYDSKMLKEIIYNNPKIISVEQVAQYLNTSVVQINRHLKKEETTCLKVVKDVKKQIAREMHEKGVSLDVISKRVGYSQRYVKENFLKKSVN